VASMLIGFNYGANLSVFPSATKDYFGLRNFGVNYGFISTAWGVGGVAGPLLAGTIADSTGSYELAYQSRKVRLYLDGKGNENKEFVILRENQAKVESLSERTDLDDLVKTYLKDAVEEKKTAFERLRGKIVKPPENFSKILSNRLKYLSQRISIP
jgi:hypothetical protein